MDTRDFQQRFLADVDAATAGIAQLFDYLPGLHFFVKNARSQFVRVSPANLALLGAAEESEVIGKTDLDFFVPGIGQRYIDEDQKVMAAARPFANRIWLVPNSSGALRWYLCTKVPLFSRAGRVVGVAGTLQDYEAAGSVLEPYRELGPVIQHISERYAEPLRVEDLAKQVGLSVSQFARRFKKMLHVSPVKYINQVRIDNACRALMQTAEPITQVALDVGFYDHSYFTKRFVEHIGLTPTQYRRQYRPGR